ncbi:unnamed protein product [Paramecium octaurelia]|uniref:Uncharacterized protein n=1 Tax=Paramecium octaurelia TaxID=43137 RepID=A0A8S1UP07_PAROT|nr:unnamed protein product [Paramecium octaurelia]
MQKNIALLLFMYNQQFDPSQNRRNNNQYRTSNQYPYNDPQINYRNQNQIYKYQEQSQKLQDQALIQYYIHEDFQNLINLIYSLQAVSEHFNHDPNNEMVILSRNKVITQLNISNSIHYDLQQNYRDPKYRELIQREKLKVQQAISQFPNDLKQSTYLRSYQQNSLSDQIRHNYQQLDKIRTPATFNQNVVSQIFSSMQLIDKNVSQIKSLNQYTVPTEQDVLAKARQYYSMTQNKLYANFQKGQQYQSQIYSKKEQFQAPQQLEWNQQQKHSPQFIQSQIITPPKQQRYQSTQHQQQKMSTSSHIWGFQNLANS